MDKLSISRFWRLRKEHYNLIGKKCLSCGYVFYPPKHSCPHCGSKALEDYVPPSEGKLITYTKLYEVPENYNERKPLYLGIARFGEMNVLIELTDIGDEGILKEGLKLELVLRKIKEDGDYGLIYYGLKARPIL